jgi:quercetin dioxygenase-like cupin family protein
MRGHIMWGRCHLGKQRDILYRPQKRRDILKLAGLPVAALFASELGAGAVQDSTVISPPNHGTRREPRVHYPVVSGTLTFDQARSRPGMSGAGGSTKYYDGPTDKVKNLLVGNWRIPPGKSPHGIHSHVDEELLILTEGTATATVDGKTSQMGPGSILYAASNVPHGVLNTGDVPMFFYFIRWIV